MQICGYEQCHVAKYVWEETPRYPQGMEKRTIQMRTYGLLLGVVSEVPPTR